MGTLVSSANEDTCEGKLWVQPKIVQGQRAMISDLEEMALQALLPLSIVIGRIGRVVCVGAGEVITVKFEVFKEIQFLLI